MTLRTVFEHGYATGWRLWRLATLVYGIQLALAVVWGMQVHSVLDKSIGHSLEISRLLSHYDHTVFADFFKVHGASVTPLIGQMRWLLPVWWLCSVFLQAGLLACAVQPPGLGEGRRFWAEGATWFWPFLRLAAVYLVLAVVWTGVVLAPVLLSLRGWLETLPTECYALGLLLLALLVWMLGLLVLYICSLMSRLSHLRQPAGTLRNLRRGWALYRAQRSKSLALVGVFLFLQAALWGLYWSVEAIWGMTSVGLVAAFFLLQQLLVWSRVLVRLMLYAGLSRLV